MDGPDFLPCTRTVSIGDGIWYRPIRSWHAGTYAGEGLQVVHGDRSGCVEMVGDREMTSPPRSAIHRLYWWEGEPLRRVSALLSYPHGLGASPNYFWEVSIGDCERFHGKLAEEEMEKAVKAFLLEGRLG